jgi:glutamine amidotransferase
MTVVSVLSYGIGNLRSVQRAFAHVGAEVHLATTPAEVASAEKLVLPGVGAFRHCAETLRDKNLWDPVVNHLASDKPFFGICVGMQLMMEASEEFGVHSGLGFIPGTVQKLPAQDGQKIPMVGWKSVLAASGSPYFRDRKAFYFIHSFAARPAHASDILGHYTYGDTQVTAAVGRGNKIGTQFHPEKSGEVGLALLDRFVKS